jgi:ABC-type multidrug transport system ATPase subunit/pSer/pThr/pTyr-binding forkhead associated (FHA) protein
MPCWIIGSGPECDLVVDQPTVSDRHCRLTRTVDGEFLEDLGSANGTFLNGVRVRGRVRVSRCDRITLGKRVPMPWPPDLPSQAPPVPARVITVGRARDNDVVIDEPMVSGRHARIVVEGGCARIEDLGSSNGTALNAPERRIDSAPLDEADVVFLGSYRIPAARLLHAGDEPAADAPSRIAVRGPAVLFGRDRACDQVLDYPMVSRRHARLSRVGDAIQIEDLGSSNGTYVNGVRVRAPVVVRPGDRIGLGSYTFTLTLSGDLERSDDRDDVTVAARDLAVDAGGRTLIVGVSLRVEPGELAGLMGPSGAGKSTLIKALAGYVRPARGQVLLNGADLEAHHAEFRGQIGYVPQEDLIHRDLTAGEALWFTARLRLPADYGDAEIRRRVRDVLEQLDLAGAEGVLIGSPTGSGMSGGQRKRVNLALELLTDPPVLLLDEPTSGLSSEDTLLVMNVLRKLADRGKAILLTIHQPGRDAFRMMDRVAVVARDAGSTEPGRLAYDGPAYPDAIRFFNPADGPGAQPGAEPSPDDLLRGLARRPVREWVERLDATGRQREGSPHRRGGTERSTPRGPIPQDLRRSSIAQWWALVRRNMALKRKDSWNTAILLAQAPIIALLIVLVFGKQAGASRVLDLEHWTEAASGVASTTFILGLAALWFGCSNAVREIVGEWPVYQRERMVNLRLGPYITSKLATLGGLCLFQCAVLLVIVRQGIGLTAAWPSTFGILVLAAAVGMALGLAISAIARTSEVAIALLPLTILPLLIFGGAMQPLHKLHPILQLGCNAFPSRWAFEGLLVLESDRRPTAPLPAGSGPAEPSLPAVAPRDMAETYFPTETERMGPRAAVITLGGTFLFLVGLIAAILRSRDLH